MLKEEIINELKHDEGFRYEPYRDHKGVWTIGFGFTSLKVKEARVAYGEKAKSGWIRSDTKPIKEKHALEILEMKVRDVFVDLEMHFPVFAKQPDIIKRVLIGMAYNNGINGLMDFKKMLGAIERKEFGLAAIECLDSKNGRDKLLNKRYITYAHMLLRGGAR